MILFIVFLPLFAAAVAGLGNRMIGNVPAKLVTTAALFASCALSWPIFFQFIGGEAAASVTPVATLDRVGQHGRCLGAARRRADGGDAGRHHHRLGARSPL